MTYPKGRSAHNRLLLSQIEAECSKRRHKLLAFNHPLVTVECYCGNVYSQKIHSYKAAKNSCKICDSRRKSKPRPQHSKLMRENNPFKGRTHSLEFKQQQRQRILERGSWTYASDERLLPGILYLIRYLDSSGIHFKIGITKKKLSERFSAEHLISVIQTWNFPLGKCFDLEQAALRYASQHGYRYASPTTTELIRPEGMVSILEFIEQSLDDDGYVAEP